MPRGVTRRVEGTHARPAELPHRAVRVADGIGPRRVEELAPKLFQHRGHVALVAAVGGDETCPALRGRQIGDVHMHGRLRQAVQGGHVVLMHVAEDHEVGGVELFADVVGDNRRVEGGLGIGAAHDDLIGIRVFAVLLAEEHRDAAEIGTRNGASTRFYRFGIDAGH